MIPYYKNRCLTAAASGEIKFTEYSQSMETWQLDFVQKNHFSIFFKRKSIKAVCLNKILLFKERKKMNQKEFADYIKENIEIILGKEASVFLQSIRKNNALVMEGICVREKNKKIAPTIYLNCYYEEYLKGKPIGEIILDILSVYQKYKAENSFRMDFFLEYENAKEKIFYKLINYQKNRALLEEIPHLAFLDLAIVFYCMVKNDQNGAATVLIHQSHLEMWQITVEELYQDAEENTKKRLPFEIKNMHQVMEELFGKEGFEITEESREQMYILTNTSKFNGAACMLYPNLLSAFAAHINSDLFILPSSIHEVILVPADGKKLQEELEKMVFEVNQTQVEQEEVLSDRVYYYSRKKKKILL